MDLVLWATVQVYVLLDRLSLGLRFALFAATTPTLVFPSAQEFSPVSYGKVQINVYRIDEHRRDESRSNVYIPGFSHIQVGAIKRNPTEFGLAQVSLSK
jgi:hypothetical protein